MKLTKFFLKSIIIILTILIISCNKREQSTPLNTTTSKDRDYYQNLALTKGDTNAYYNLNVYYMEAPIENILYTAIVMANKHDYHLAYLNIYEALTSHDHKKGVSELEDLDTITRKMALDYLIKGAEKGNKECKNILGNHYLDGKYIKKDITKGKQLIEESNR